MAEELVQNSVMNENFVKSSVMNAKIDPKVVMDLLRGFWARGRVRGDRSVFFTSHRPVHLSRELLFSA